MRYALALAIIVSLSFGLIQESFRYQSTAGLWEDDYDLLFDPARIYEINGSRLWTSLSNFVTGDENQFSNGSVPYILLGASKNFGNYYPGLVYDRSNQKDPLDTGLDDVNGNPIYGDGELSIIDWNDIDNNGEYDQRTLETEQRSAYDLYKDNNYYIGLGTKRGTLRFGLGYLHESYTNTFTNPLNNFTYSYVEENIPTDTTFINQADFAGDSIYGGSENGLLLSIWLDQQKMSWGLAVGYNMLSGTDKALILGDSAIYTDPTDLTTFYTAANVLDSMNIPESGNQIAVELKNFYNYSQNVQGRFYLGFYMESGSISDDASAYYHKTHDEIYTDFTWNTLTTTSYHDGANSSMGFRLGTKQLFKVSERLKFGIGFFFGSYNSTDSVAVRNTSVELTAYDDNDGNVFDPDDDSTWVWSSETWMTKTTQSNHVLTFPVGLEFYLAQPLVFRLGAIHQISKGDYTTVINLIQYQPERTLTKDNTGTIVEDLIDPGPEPVGSEETGKTNAPQTDYYYGVGWQVNDNLQIDLMSFAQLTNLANWRLSATLKF